MAEMGRLRPLRDPISSIAPELTPPQVHCLMWLGMDGPLSSSVVAERVGCGLPTVTGLVDRLVRVGYVERERDTGDRRVVRVKLTAAGAKVARVLDETITERLGLFLGAMTAVDRAHVMRIMRGIVERLRKYAPSAEKA